MLNELLTVKNSESIHEILGRMEALLQYFRSNKDLRGFAPFLQLYKDVTACVYTHVLHDEKYFENYHEIERLDVVFATLYFEPMKEFLLYRKTPSPWSTYFAYCQSKKQIPFLSVLLGINAHINSDLLTALHLTEYKSKNDFDKINEILLELIPVLMKELLLEYKDPWGLGGIIAKPIFRFEFEKTIVSWRNTAWSNYAASHGKLSSHEIQLYHIQTEEIGLSIIKIFNKLTHLKKIIGDIKELNNLKVTLSEIYTQN